MTTPLLSARVGHTRACLLELAKADIVVEEQILQIVGVALGVIFETLVDSLSKEDIRRVCKAITQRNRVATHLACHIVRVDNAGLAYGLRSTLNLYRRVDIHATNLQECHRRGELHR